MWYSTSFPTKKYSYKEYNYIKEFKYKWMLDKYTNYNSEEILKIFKTYYILNKGISAKIVHF